MSLGINRMSIENHRILCGKRVKNLRQPINSPFIDPTTFKEVGEELDMFP
jgi:hypothetical protein